MTMRDDFLKAGMKPEEISNWCSDLYVLKNEISEKIISEYEFKKNVSTFLENCNCDKPHKRGETCNFVRRTWYDIPFAYTEYYSKRT